MKKNTEGGTRRGARISPIQRMWMVVLSVFMATAVIVPITVLAENPRGGGLNPIRL
jgi:hypothetical protein